MVVVVAGGPGQVELHRVLLRQGGKPQEGRRTEGQRHRQRYLQPVEASPVDHRQQRQVGQQQRGEQQAGDVVIQVQGGEQAGGGQEPASPALQRQAPEGPQREGQQGQGHRFRCVAARQGVEQLIRCVGVGDPCDDSGCRAEQVPGQQVGPYG